MANIENNSEKNDKQTPEFAKNQELKSKVYDAIEEQLIKSTEEAFKSDGIKTRKSKDADGEQGWNRGVYGDGSTYGVGVKKGQDTITVSRVKGPKATNGFFEKNLSYGGKKMVVEIHIDIDCESETMDITYQSTEQAAFRGYGDKENGPYMTNDKKTIKIDNISDFKKNLKKILDKFAKKEAAYFISTKLGVEDKTEKSINSMVESNMKKISLTDIIKSDYKETLEKVMESTKKNHPEIVDANTKGKLLFDDEEIEEETVDEITASAGGSGAGAFLAPINNSKRFNDEELKKESKTNEAEEIKYKGKNITVLFPSGMFEFYSDSEGRFIKSTDLDSIKKTIDKEELYANLQEKFEETPYSKRDKKRALKRENTNGWTTVELDSDGYAPKGMNKNHALGLHGVEVNSAEEDRLSKGSPKGRGAMKGKKGKGLSEGYDQSKKKFVSLVENEEKGINKRYIITHKKTSEEESNRWKNLAGFEKNSTIRIAESCGAPIEDGKKIEIESQKKEVISENFMKRNDGVDHGDEVGEKKVIVVDKPGSLSNVTFKVYEEDYLNESKSFILDMKTGNLVNNPNYKIEVEEVEEIAPINENIEIKKEVKNPNTAYYFNKELGRLVRNIDYKP